MRWFALLAALFWASVSFAADQKPLVRDVTTGQTREIPAAGTLLVPAIKDSGITGSTQCVQANSVGLFSGTGAGCGTITLTNHHIFVGNASNVATDVAMSGDATIINTGAITVSKTGGVSFGYFATGTDASNLTGTVSVNRFNSGTSASATTWLRGDGTWVTPSGSGIGTVTSVTCGTGLSGGVITTSGTCSITAPVTVALGGTNATSASGTALDNISGFASTGFLTRTGAGTYAFQSATNGVTNANLAQIATNTVVGNSTNAAANRSAMAMPSCSGSANALIWTTNSGFSCQSPVPATSANPFQIGTAYVGSGDGITGLNCTSITTLTEGSLCMRTDVSGLYRMWLPNTLVPTRVQEKTAAATYAVTLGTTPVPGDYLIAACFRYGSLPVTNTGWFSKATYNSTGGNDSYIRVVTKLVSVSDTTSQTPCTGTDTNSYSVAVIEVSGLDMVNFNNSLAHAVTFANVTGTGAITATITYTTAETNNLGVAMFGMTTANPNNAVSQSFNAGWTNVDAPNGSNTLTRGSSAAVASQTFASSGTGVTASGTGGNSTFSQEGLTEVLIMLKQPTGPNVGMQQMSDLTTVYSAGVQINPTGTSSRSLNFTTGLAGTDDGNGAETITLGTLSGDCTNSGAALTCLKTNGTNFGTFATQNYATPPAIGATTPAAGSFSTLTDTGVTGTAANCAYFDTAGLLHGTGTACGSSVGGTVTSVTCPGVVITSTGVCLNTITPQGRLTLVTGVAVMVSDQIAKGTLYYDCYAGKLVPYYDGTNDLAEAITSCEVSTAMQASSTGVLNSGGVFDVWWAHGGASRICVATNGSGGGWASDTSGSNTARGTVYSAVHNTRGYWTNTASITHCYNGSTDYGTLSADQATYLGTIYTSAAGKVDVAFQPAAASAGPATAPIVGIWNAYNRVMAEHWAQDSKTSWNYTSATWRAADASNQNRVSWVDGLTQSFVRCDYHLLSSVAGSVSAAIGCDLDSTSATPVIAGLTQTTVANNNVVTNSFLPQTGFHFVQAVESGATTATFYGNGYMQLLARMEYVVANDNCDGSDRLAMKMAACR